MVKLIYWIIAAIIVILAIAAVQMIDDAFRKVDHAIVRAQEVAGASDRP